MKASEIYRQIVKIKKISIEEDSYIRNLKKKMTFLLEQVALRKEIISLYQIIQQPNYET